MTASFYISMTSGIRGPEGELPNEQAAKVLELTQQLTEECSHQHRGLSDLHATNYIISWNNEDSPVNSVHVDAYGYTMVWVSGATDWKYYKDTVGLWGYLAPFGQTFLRQWLDNAERFMKEFNEKMFPVPGQEKV